jgi:hypothetical protein
VSLAFREAGEIQAVEMGIDQLCELVHLLAISVSWLAARDVSEGREAMNFSRWNTLDARRLAKLREEIPETVVEEEMPLRLYSLTHPAARLSAADRAKLVAWGRSVGPAGTGAEAPAVGASTSG